MLYPVDIFVLREHGEAFWTKTAVWNKSVETKLLNQRRLRKPGRDDINLNSSVEQNLYVCKLRKVLPNT